MMYGKKGDRVAIFASRYTVIYINCLLDGTKYIIFRPRFNKNFDVIRDFSFFSFAGKGALFVTRISSTRS